jgi:LacI family transcriptional regulator
MAERVRKAAEELSYVPDARARSLKVGRTFQLTLAVADVGNPVYVTMMRAVASVVSAAGYRLVVTTTGQDVIDEVALVRGMARGYADGLVPRRTSSRTRVRTSPASPVRATWRTCRRT